MNTHYVDNSVVQNLKPKYFRLIFKRRALFGPKPLKYNIELYFEFCEKNIFKIYTD